MSLRTIGLTLALASSAFSGEIAHPALVTHEWGTFTSVARKDGTPVPWAPLSGPGDLPCFVDRLGPQGLKLSQALVRMETPVLYFYAQEALTLSVHVSFPQGWITEWYPRATKVEPKLSPNFVPTPNARNGEIEWTSVRVLPAEHAEFPTSRGASHYYAARNTDSAPLRIGEQQEKFIFYRGMGDFTVPLEPRFNDAEKIEIRTVGRDPAPLLTLFENREGRIGFRVARGQRNPLTLEAPELTGDLADLQRQMTNILMEFGLYRKEAEAMIETWRDSWFEEGTRVFYIVPRSMVDSALPLTITPAPVSLARVFVGRIEILSPAVEQTIETALAKGDITTLKKLDRFFAPFASQLREASTRFAPSPGLITPLQRIFQEVQTASRTAACVQ